MSLTEEPGSLFDNPQLVPYSARERALAEIIAGMTFGQKRPNKAQWDRCYEAARSALRTAADK